MISGRNWTIQMLSQLSSHFGAVVRCFLPTMRFITRRSLLANLEVRPELLWLLEGFPCFLNSLKVLDIVALEKPSSSAVLVTAQVI